MSAKRLSIGTLAATLLLLLMGARMGAQVFIPDPPPIQPHDPDPWQITLGLSDEEWAAVEPRLEKVIALRQHPDGAVVYHYHRLHHLLKYDARADVINEELQALREARSEAEFERACAEADLRQILSVRQEATLVAMDLLD